MTGRLLVVFLICGLGASGCERGDDEEPPDVTSPDAAGDVPEEEPFEPFERPQEGDSMGRWIPGDLHAHSAGASNDVPEHSTPARIREVAVERGLEFVVMTDHSNSTGSDPWTLEEDPELFNQGPEFTHWDLARILSDEAFILVQGNEISPVHPTESGPTGHIGCIPRSLVEFDPSIAFVDRPRGTVPGGDALDQALEANCFAILNHPYGPSWISYDWTSYEYPAMEVWNGGGRFNPFDEQAMKAWACDLSQGRRVIPVGGSDNHDIESEPPGEVLRPALGVPVTWVYGAELDWDVVIQGLERGRVSISDTGTPLEIDAFDREGRFLSLVGGDLPAGAVTVRLQGARQEAGPQEPRYLELMRQAAGVCQDTRVEGEIRVPEPGWEVVSRRAVAPGEGFDVLVEVDVEEGDVLFAWMVPDPIGLSVDVAISGALFVGWP